MDWAATEGCPYKLLSAYCPLLIDPPIFPSPYLPIFSTGLLNTRAGVIPDPSVGGLLEFA